MTAGAIISSGIFGKTYQVELSSSHERELNFAFAKGKRVGKCRSTISNGCYCFSRNSLQFHYHHANDYRIRRKGEVFFGELEMPISNCLGNFHKRNFSVINLKRGLSANTSCFLLSDPFNNSRLQLRKVDYATISDSLRKQLEERWVATTHANLRPEQYEVTGSQFDTLGSSEGSNEVVLEKEDQQELSDLLVQQLPKRWIIVLLCFSAFLLCNMDRVNMSIAILPMSAEFNWTPATVGLIQSSFFWGYLLTQIAGGIWADKVGGKVVLGFGVVWWSVATILTPIAARVGLPSLLIMRAFMGIGEGVAMPAMNNILSKWIPVSERSRSLAVVYSGMYLGSVTGLAFSPMLIHKFGWPSVFYAFGSLGGVWFTLWRSKAHSSPKEDPELSMDEKRLILDGNVSKEPVVSIPWKLILSKPPVWALIISHFCHNWGTFILLTWMPTYYNQI